ncbi:MAG: ATP-binding protein, partial [Mucilaginibacter polytrichastri]|nr:ATP-binding protein [Mucilaginibacter polytrichastri]
EKYHELIFENNVTMNQTDRFNQKGTGIGLATVKSLINHMKGEISLKSARGEGTIFYLTLPK